MKIVKMVIYVLAANPEVFVFKMDKDIVVALRVHNTLIGLFLPNGVDYLSHMVAKLVVVSEVIMEIKT